MASSMAAQISETSDNSPALRSGQPVTFLTAADTSPRRPSTLSVLSPGTFASEVIMPRFLSSSMRSAIAVLRLHVAALHQHGPFLGRVRLDGHPQSPVSVAGPFGACTVTGSPLK